MNKNIQMAKNSTEIIWDYIATSAPSFRPASICEASGWRWNAARLFCALYHCEISCTSIVTFFIKKAELQGAAPQPLRFVWLPPCSRASFLRAGYSTTQVSTCSLSRNWFHGWKKSHRLSAGESLFQFPILLDRKERFLRSQFRAKTEIQSFELLPEGGSFNSRSVVRRFIWEAGC